MKPFDLGRDATCDLDQLVDTRLLVQANSGGGKSWALRRLLEQTHGRVQHLVLDPEGEFSTLRERFDYVLAARQQGDTVADPRSAKLLAERLLELGVSAVLDIYELKAHERVKFVRAFLEALVDAPKKLWHPALVVVDECHVYCPQVGEAESAGAVIDLATRGRKRGFCAVLATQRLSKLHKDAAAECNNKLIGRTGLDVDMKRAADELGLTGREDVHQLRALSPGDFFAFGPALSPSVKRIHVGAVQTSHPKAGARLAFTPPPPTAKVKALLPKLADLPAEAEERTRTLQETQRELSTVKRQLTLAQRGAPIQVKEKTVEKRIEVPVLKDGQLARLEKVTERWSVVGADVVSMGRELAQVLAKIAGNGHRPPIQHQTQTVAARQAMSASATEGWKLRRERAAHTTPRSEGLTGSLRLRKGAIRMLEAIARRYPVPSTVAQVGQLAGLARSGGTFSTYLSDLRRGGYILERGDFLELTVAGWTAVGLEPGAVSPQTTEEVLQLYAGVLRAGARRMLDALMGVYPDAMIKEALGAEARVETSGGTFGTYLSDLRRAGLVEEVDDGVRASELLMDPAAAAR